MGQSWKTLEAWANRFGIWFTALSAMIAFFGWVASHLIAFKGYGWAEATFAGLFATLAIVFVSSLVLIAWRFFRPLPQTAKQGGVWLPANGVPDISTPELGRDLRAEISALEKSLSAKIGALTGMISKLQHETTVDYPNASTIAEAFKNLDQAVNHKTDRIEQEIKEFSQPIALLEKDIGGLLLFATDLATLAVLEEQIAEGSRLQVPLGPDVEMAERERKAAEATDFLRSVRSAYAGTHRGMEVGGCIQNAENEADWQLREMPADQRPSYIDLLDYRKLWIAETCRMRLLAYLKHQRADKKGHIRRQRLDLLERLSARKLR